MNKKANTTAKLISQIINRWSPRSFQEKSVSSADLNRILEAARWAPSCFNEQPWRFIVGVKGVDEIYSRILSVLAEGNQIWARKAPVLMIMLAKINFSRNDKHNDWAEYDTGQAAAYLTIQATDLNIFVHQMGGFDRTKTMEVFKINQEYQPVSALALGYRGDSSSLPPDLKKMEESERQRKSLDELILR